MTFWDFLRPSRNPVYSLDKGLCHPKGWRASTETVSGGSTCGDCCWFSNCSICSSLTAWLWLLFPSNSRYDFSFSWSCIEASDSWIWLTLGGVDFSKFCFMSCNRSIVCCCSRNICLWNSKVLCWNSEIKKVTLSGLKSANQQKINHTFSRCSQRSGCSFPPWKQLLPFTAGLNLKVSYVRLAS